MTEDQWKTLEGCIGESTTGQLKGLASALRMMPEKTTSLGLGVGSDWPDIMDALQRAPGASVSDADMFEALSEAVDFASSNGALTGNERPLA